MMSQEIATTEESPSLLAVIAKAASDPSVDIEKMDRLLQMQERLEMRGAEADFNEAMTKAQTEMGRVKTNQANTSTKSRYADYASLDRALRPIYTKHGFALSFNTDEGAAADAVRVVCLVSRGRFTRSYHVDMPADGKGAKGGDVMTKTHATGAAMTYGMRYLLKMIFNVAIGEDDTDGNMGEVELVSIEELADLQTKLANVEGDVAAFCEHFKIDALADMPKSYLPTALQIIANKARKMGK